MRRPYHVPICLGVAFASGLWGLYWIPQRELEAGGLTGGWGTIAQFLIPVAVMTPFMIWRSRRYGRDSGASWVLVGVLTGGGIVCYANSFLLTDVVRALLLFYLTPVWATLLERFVMKQTITPSRYLALALALGGVWIVFGKEGGLPLPANAGDWIALAGGMLIACGAARIDVMGTRDPLPVLYAFYLYGAAIALATGWLLQDELGPPPALGDLVDMLPFLLALVFLLHMPSSGFLIWSPSRIGAGVFGILLLTELLTGAASAAVWADEPFGWRESLGCLLVLVAGTIEIVKPGRVSGEARA